MARCWRQDRQSGILAHLQFQSPGTSNNQRLNIELGAGRRQCVRGALTRAASGGNDVSRCDIWRGSDQVGDATPIQINLEAHRPIAGVRLLRGLVLGGARPS
jgi:hypothetical protein